MMMRLLALLPLLFTLTVRADGFSVASGLRLPPAASIGAGTDDLLAVWSDESGRLARRFSFAGDSLDTTPLRLSDDRFAAVSIASDGLTYLVVIAETSGTRARVLARHLTREGRLSEPVLLLEGEREGVVVPKVAAAWNGVDFLVAWSDSLRWNDAWLNAALITSDGVVRKAATLAGPLQTIDGLSVAIGADRDLIVSAAREATSAQAFLAVLDSTLLDRNLNPHGSARVDVIEGVYAGCTGITTIGSPAAAWNGSNWAIGWKRSSCRFGEGIFSARLAENASAFETRLITPMRLATAKLDLLGARDEAVLLTQMHDVVSGIYGSPVDLHRLDRSLPAHRLLSGAGPFDATATAGGRVAIAFENAYAEGSSEGWGVTVRLFEVAREPHRRRAVR